MKPALSSTLEAFSLEELTAHIAEAQTILDKKREDIRRKFVEETRQKAQSLGLSLNDLFADSSAKKSEPRSKTEKPAERQKVAVKYRDPSNAENSWTGRGMTPRWLREKIEAGAKLEDFLVTP